METKINKLVFSNDGKKVKVAFKDGTATIDFESKIDAIKAILFFVKEKRIEGEEFIKWLGLICSLKTLYEGDNLEESLPEEIVGEVVKITKNLKEAFFSMYFSGENIGQIFTKDGNVVRFFITSKNFGFKMVKKLLEEYRLIDSNEAEKLTQQIEESTLPKGEVSPIYDSYFSKFGLPPLEEN